MMKIIIKKSVYDEIMKSHKYISRWFKNSKWEYRYPSDQPRNNNRKKSRREIALRTPVISGFDLLPENSTKEDIEKELNKIKKISQQGKLNCPALGNSRIYVNNKSFSHIFYSRGMKRNPEKVREKSKYIRFIPSILKYGKLSEKSYSDGNVVYGVACRANVEGETKVLEVAVCYDRKNRKCYLSMADDEIKKALNDSAFSMARSMFSTNQNDSQTAVSHADSSIPHTVKKSMSCAEKSRGMLFDLQKSVGEVEVFHFKNSYS